jgi:hypothetical protein
MVAGLMAGYHKKKRQVIVSPAFSFYAQDKKLSKKHGHD